MQKKIIALAVAAALTAPAAFAETSNVSLYGTVDMAFGSVSNGATSATNVSSNVTKFGIKGSEDLGDGLAAIWQIEQQVDIDNPAATGGGSAHNTLANRNSFGGLKSNSMGTVLMGTHDTPYKIATRGLDPFGDELADNRAIMGAAGAHDARLTNVLAYISPAMSGFTAAAAYVTGAELPVSGATKANVYSMAGMYNAEAFNIDLAYQSIKIGTAGTGSFGAGTTAVSALNGLAVNDKTSAWKLGGSYTFDSIKLNAIYEKIKSNIALTGADTLGRTDLYLSGVYSFSNDAVKLAFARSGNVGGVANTGGKQYSLGYDHNLSKRTKIYGVYTRVSNDSATKAFGVSNTGSTAGGVATATNGASASGWGVGFKHSF